MKRLVYDVLALLSCILLPWMLAATIIIIGILLFDDWLEGFCIALVLDVVMFGGVLGWHTFYVAISYCALYYLSIRFKQMLRVS